MKSILVEASGPLPSTRDPLPSPSERVCDGNTVSPTLVVTPIGHLRNTLTRLPPYHRREHLIHPALRSWCLTHRHGTPIHAASHQPRATEPFGGVLARTELQFLRAELSRLRVVRASMSQLAQAVACESSISIPYAVLSRCCYRKRGTATVAPTSGECLSNIDGCTEIFYLC